MLMDDNLVPSIHPIVSANNTASLITQSLPNISSSTGALLAHVEHVKATTLLPRRVACLRLRCHYSKDLSVHRQHA